MNRKLYYLLIPFLIISCGKTFLDRDPTYYSNKTEAYSNIESIQSALNGCYDGLQDYRYYGRNFYLMTEVSSDNAKLAYANHNNFISFYNFALTSSSTELDGFWKIGYKIISRANTIIDATNKLNTVPYTEKRQILGEALALRALVYFDLVRIFAQTNSIGAGVDSANFDGGHVGIPIITLPTTKDSLISPVRSSVKAVYNQIISDLLKADTMLIPKQSVPYYFSSYSVKALLAKVFLTKGSNSDLANANNYSSYLINLNEYDLVPNVDYIDSWNSSYTKESIFSIPMTLTDNQGTNSIGYMLSKLGYGDLVSTQDLYDLFSENDIRKSLFKKGKDINIFKYPGRDKILGLDNVPIIRFSEMYLIKAEALVRLSFMDANKKNKDIYQNTARLLLDTLRKRADINAIPTNLVDNDLLELIYTERRKEFMFEGQRFFDIKRRMIALKRNDCNASVCTVNSPSYLFAFPIPVSEINANKNIKQNPNY